MLPWAPSLAPNIQPVESLSRSAPFHGRTPITTRGAAQSRERALGYCGSLRPFRGLPQLDADAEPLGARPRAASAATVRDTFVVGDANRKQGLGRGYCDLLGEFAPGADQHHFVFTTPASTGKPRFWRQACSGTSLSALTT